MARGFISLFLVFLSLSQLLCLLAVPVTRSENLIRETLIQKAPLDINQGKDWMQETNGRIAVEVNDYPGSGANYRHTPRPQFGKACVDC